MNSVSGRAPSGAGHLPALDAVRGLAITLVILHHLANSAQVEFGLRQPWVPVLQAGWVGVDLFFVLSGFLITRGLLAARQSPAYFRNFYARRTLRIFPLYYGALGAMHLLAATVPSLSPMVGTGAHAWAPWAYLTNLYIALAGWETYGWFGHFWSLAIEEHFYLLWPAVIYVCASGRLVHLCLVIMAGVLALRVAANTGGVPADAIYVMTPFRADALVMGALLAAMSVDPQGSRRLRQALLVVGALAAAGLGLIGLREGALAYRSGWVHTIGFSLLTAAFGALVGQVAWHDRHWAVRLVNRASLRSLGKYSYGLYVVHTPIFVWWFHSPDGQQLLRSAGLWSPLGATVAALATTAAVASASWHFWERPFLNLKGRFSDHVEPEKDDRPALSAVHESAIRTTKGALP